MFRSRFAGSNFIQASAARRIRNALLAVLAFSIVTPASAYEVFENGRLRFGTGAEASVNANGNLQQPFYYDAAATSWYQLTFSNYPLDNRIGIGGDGANEWNVNGTIVENGALAGQVLDTSAFAPTNGSIGYGRIVSTGTVTIDGKTLELKNTYELPADKSFVKITTRLTNTSGSSVGNVRVWVGTRDDFVGASDRPTKVRGNLANGAFTQISTAATRAAALKIYSGETGVLFYSTSEKAHTSIQNCCAFQNATQQSPLTSAITLTNDGSYALFVRMADLADGAYEEFTWYYAAGPVASLDTVVQEVANDGGGTIAVGTSAGSNGSISPVSADVSTGATTAFTITPDSGYHIDAVSGCGGSLSGNTFTTAAIANACTVSATFAIDTHVVSASAGAGGTLGPSQATVNHNATTSFTIAPHDGYDIANVEGCNGTRSGNVFTTGPITSACSVSATFAQKTYAVTASASAGGSISPANRIVAHGSTASFDVAPASGYHIASVTGCAGALSGASFTTGAITGSCSVTAAFAITPPAFDAAQPPPIDINARELFTVLPSNVKPKAFAYDGGELAVALVNGQDRYEPGQYTLIWKASDARGISTTIEQVLRVWPTVSFGPDVTIGARAGNSAFFRIALNGRSPVYPFTVDYIATGDLQGHDLESGRVVFAQGEVEKTVSFAVSSTTSAGTADREVRVALDSALNRMNDRPLVVTFTSLNKAPAVRIAAAQGGTERPAVARNAGPITLDVTIDDPNTSDTHTVQWSGPSSAVFTRSGDGIVIQPGSLPAGVHRFELTVTDNGSPPIVTRSIYELVVREADVELPNGATALLSNGLPNHPAYAPVAPNVLPERAGELSHHIMEADAGTQLRLGSYALLRGSFQTEVEGAIAGSSMSADSIANVGGYFDFTISELPQVGKSVNVVIPQRSPVPAQPVYRKYDPATSRWMTFVEDNHNRLASAPGSEGFCPPTTSPEYRSGLTPGDWCVRLTLEDGGPNDADKQANGSIADPGGVGSMSNVVVTGQAGGKGGGGAFDWILVALATVLMLARLARSRAAFVAILASMSFAASADESSHAYAGFSVGAAQSGGSEGDLTRKLQQRGYDATARLSDTTRSAWRAHLGYQWTDLIGFEGGYSDLGRLKSSFTGVVGDPDRFLVDTNDLHPMSAEGFDLSALARLPLGPSLHVKARAGAFLWSTNVRTYDGATQNVKRSRNGADLVYGIGLDVRLPRKVSLTVDGARYIVDDEHIDFIGAGLSYRW